MNNAPDIIFDRLPGNGGDIGEILLNRPHALNALTQDMCEQLFDRLSLWRQDDQIKAVIIRGAGNKAFCAGGDIRTLYNHGPQAAAQSLAFFQAEYCMNAAIYHFNKPYIAILDGITMGGGAGLSIHGSHQVATEKLIFAMPETSIGFFPDVGAGHFLTQLNHATGCYLGLTGHKLGALDALQINLVNHAIPSCHIKALINALCETKFDHQGHGTVSQIIKTWPLDLNDHTTALNHAAINRCFTSTTVEKILHNLMALNNDWGSQTQKRLLTKSPTSLKVTLAHLNRAKDMDFDSIMKAEFKIAAQTMLSHDFYEGVRAVIIAKDHQAKWQPSQLDAVSQQAVEAYFANQEQLVLPRLTPIQ